MRDSWWGSHGLDSRSCNRPLHTGWVGASIMWPAETKVMVFPLCLVCGMQHFKLSDFSLGTRPRYSLVVDDDVKKRNNQTNLITNLKWITLQYLMTQSPYFLVHPDPLRCSTGYWVFLWINYPWYWEGRSSQLGWSGRPWRYNSCGVNFHVRQVPRLANLAHLYLMYYWP